MVWFRDVRMNMGDVEFGLTSVVAHPLIHLGFAYELNSRTVAIEALALGTCFYSSLHKYVDDPKYTKPSPIQSKSLLDILHTLLSVTSDLV